MNGANVFYGRMLESRVGALLEWHLHRKRRSKTQSLGAGFFPPKGSCCSRTPRNRTNVSHLRPAHAKRRQLCRGKFYGTHVGLLIFRVVF